MVEYKVVETSMVTDESLEHILNDWTNRGWHFDAIQFALREGSRRPAMAFVIFTRAKKRILMRINPRRFPRHES